MTKRVFIIYLMWLSFVFPGYSWATLHYYSGTMEGKFVMTHSYAIYVPSGFTSLTSSFTLPEDYSLPTNTQSITDLNVTYSGTPSEEYYTDKYGCHYVKLTWMNPSKGTINVTISYTVSSGADWNKFVTSDPYPFDNSGLPASVTDFLQPSPEVQSDHPIFINLVNDLTNRLITQWEVMKVLNGWVMDNIYYATNPYGIDALTTFVLGLGSCSNYAHIALALVRAAGIPARLTHGYSLNKSYTLPTENGPINPNWGQGTHAWIEVYYPSLGWIPYDPQRDFHHVDTHRVLWGRGVDTTGIVGRTSWTTDSFPSRYPTMNDTLNVDWLTDSIDLSYIKSTYEVATFALSAPVTFIPVHTITASANGSGIISPAGKVTVSDGTEQTFTITPDPDYYVADVLIDSESQGTISAYTFDNVTADHTIIAYFLLIDSDGDDLPDWWEQQIIDYSQGDEINAFEDVLPEGDFDGDNFSNIKEYQEETDPTDVSSHPPRSMPWLMLLFED